jgi:hypothetical protein
MSAQVEQFVTAVRSSFLSPSDGIFDKDFAACAAAKVYQSFSVMETSQRIGSTIVPIHVNAFTLFLLHFIDESLLGIFERLLGRDYMEPSVRNHTLVHFRPL